MGEVSYRVGIPESSRRAAAELFDEAFRAKLAPGIRDPNARIDVLAAGMDLAKGIAALDGDELVGIAGFHDPTGSLTGGITFGILRRRLGMLRALRAIAVFALLERTPERGELLMDGIVVRADARGRGIGTGLFSTLERHGGELGLGRIRLDVVDTNPAARRLYERLGFRPTATSRLPFLRPIMGFAASTTMVKDLTAS